MAVGGDDIVTPNTFPAAVMAQGTNRCTRAAAWVQAIQANALARGAALDVTLHYIPHATHSMKECLMNGLDEILVRFLS
jgi:hypothetical protein